MDRGKKSSEPKKRKVYVSDSSDEEDFDFKKKPAAGKSTSPATSAPAAKLPRKEKKGEVNTKSLKAVTPADMFGTGGIKKYMTASSKAPSTSASSSKSKPEEVPIVDEPPKTNGSGIKKERESPRKNSKQEEPETSKHSRSPSSRKNSRDDSTAREAESSRHSRSPSKKSSQEDSKKTDSSTNRGSSSSPSKRQAASRQEVKVKVEKKEKIKKEPSAEFKKPGTSKSNEVTPKKKAASKRKKSDASASPKDKKKKTPRKKKPKVEAPELTEEEKEEKKRKLTSNFLKHLSRPGPKHLGSKEIPVGTPDCLEGLTFVTTGVLDSFERDDVVKLVEDHGGRVTGGVSGRTTHLIVGSEPGDSKLKKARDLKIPQISEDDLLDMIRKSNPNQPAARLMFGVASDDDEEDEDEETDSSEEEEAPITKKPLEQKQQESPSKDSGVGSSQSQSLITPEPSTSAKVPKREEAIKKPAGISTLMWVDKYKPTSIKNVVGQAGDKSNAHKLLKYLEDWFIHHGKAGDKAQTRYPGFKETDGKHFKAALLSGPPGIGKTSTAHLVCKQLGYDFFEMNASDTRNKKGLHEVVSDALSSQSIVKMGSRNELTSKHVLIMDEVDGMSGNEDRGGIQELINLIKMSRVPIICICNDRNHQKIRSLANYCFDLRFYAPNNSQLRAFVQSICFKEKLRVPAESIQQLINSSDHDIRQILNHLELFKESKSVESICNPKKDLKFGPWDVCRKVFSASEHEGMTINDKSNLFFQDYSFGPLFVQENYIKWTPNKTRHNIYKTLDRIKMSAEAIATGDLVDNIVRRSNAWSLLPTQAIFSSILPGEYMEGDDVSGIEFPRWLGKNSTRGKMARLIQQLHTHVHLEVSGSLEALNMDYLPYLRRSVVNPLVGGDTEAAVKAMQDYSLMREDLDNINELAQWPGMKKPMDSLDSRTKASFTRQLNKELFVPYSLVKVTKGRGRGGGAGAEAAEGLEEEDELGQEEEDEEEGKLEKDANVKIKKRKTYAAEKSKSPGKKGSKIIDDEEEDEDDDKPKPSSSKSSKKRKGENEASSSKKSRTRK